jgi:hypothetical protein
VLRAQLLKPVEAKSLVLPPDDTNSDEDLDEDALAL